MTIGQICQGYDWLQKRSVMSCRPGRGLWGDASPQKFLSEHYLTPFPQNCSVPVFAFSLEIMD